MRYPRKIMKTTELMNECGFTYRYLMKLAHIPDQKYARKLPGGRHFYWDTEKFERAQERYAAR